MTPGTLNKAVRRLIRDGLVHDLLVTIGADPEVADVDAEGIELHVGDETLAAFRLLERRAAARGQSKLQEG